jgi:hypothetical protein
MKSSVAVHSLLVYRKGLLGIKLAAEFMRANASTVTGVDPLRLALKVRTHHQVRSVPLLMMSLYYSIVHGPWELKGVLNRNYFCALYTSNRVYNGCVGR